MGTGEGAGLVVEYSAGMSGESDKYLAEDMMTADFDWDSSAGWGVTVETMVVVVVVVVD
jgi:hypothetical protein